MMKQKNVKCLKSSMIAFLMGMVACEQVPIKSQHSLPSAHAPSAAKKMEKKNPTPIAPAAKKTSGGVVPASVAGAGSAVASAPALTAEAQFQQQRKMELQKLELEEKYWDLFQLLVATHDHPAFFSEQSVLKKKAVDLVDYKLNESELQKLSGMSEFKDYRCLAALKYAEMLIRSAQPQDAKSYLMLASESTDESVKSVANSRLYEMESLQKTDNLTVGTVLPLTGKYQTMAQKTLRGLQMGLGISPASSDSKIKLAIIDSEGNPDLARRGVEKLVKEDHVIGVVGSLLSKTATAVAAKSNELGVPSVGLSQKSALTDVGPLVFRNSLTSEMQVRELVRSAMEDMGLKKFAILFPNDSYGVEYANLFWDEVLARGGEITAAQTYSNKETDFRIPVQRLIGTYLSEFREEEYRLRAKELHDNAGPKKSIRQSQVDNVLPPIVDYEAIFIPDSVKTLGQIAAMLSYNDVRGIKLLGTNLWNVPNLSKRAGNFSKEIYFVDGGDFSNMEKSNGSFYNQYKVLFGEEPGNIELQAYETGLIFKNLIASGAESREDLARGLRQLKQFPGVLQTLTVDRDREIQRPVFTYKIDKNEVVRWVK